MGTKIIRMNSRVIDFLIEIVGKHLKLPFDSLLLENMHGLTRVQHEELFEEKFSWIPKGRLLDKAQHHWSPWFKFVNDYLVFRPKRKYGDPKDHSRDHKYLGGLHNNNAKTMQQKMREKLASKLVGRPIIAELYSTSNIFIYWDHSLL